MVNILPVSWLHEFQCAPLQGTLEAQCMHLLQGPLLLPEYWNNLVSFWNTGAGLKCGTCTMAYHHL
jgi:hypothetical protein